MIKEVSNKDEVKWTMLQKFYAKVLKRILDLFFGILIFVLLIPLFLIMPLVIRLDTKGETIFKQKNS